MMASQATSPLSSTASSPKTVGPAPEVGSNPLAGIPPSSARAAAPTERFEPSWDEERATLNKELAKDEDVTRVAPTPWFASESMGNPPATAAPGSGSAVARATPPGLASEDEKEPVHPASRPDIGPRDTVRGQLRPVGSVPPEVPPAMPEASGKGLPAHTLEVAKGTTSLAPTVRSPNAPLLRPNLEPGPQELRSKTMVRPRIRRRSRRWVSVLVWCSLTLALISMLILSYRYRQPKAFYEYLRVRRWDIALDRQVQRFIVKPYRQVVPPPKPRR
ncbi:MAG: hypothetical protein QM784_15480 [Polyangiaceae bacterium]